MLAQTQHEQLRTVMNGQKASTSYDRQVWHWKEFLFLAQFPNEVYAIVVHASVVCQLSAPQSYYHYSA